MTQNNENKTFYVTTAIDYATGNPHLGHAYEKIGADVIARWNRNINTKTFFLTGTDEHGQKVVETANKNNLQPQEFVNKETQKFIELTKTLNLTNDYFIRTTNQDHKEFVQKMLQKSFDNGDIYLSEYSGLYCVGCERYYTQKELLEGNLCPDHKKPCQEIKDENYFFKLSKYEDKLLKLYEENPDFISPKHRKQEIINRVKDGLQDISISRNKETLEWGIEFPFDKNHVTYVWFDALFNYKSTTSNLNKDEFWPCNVHIIGKDIMWFHMVYWPAFLMSCGIDLPKKVFAHGHILDENGHKMSKSLGNVVNPFEEIENFGLDEFRYFLMALGSFGEDLNYSHKIFAEKVNNELNNDFGNLVSRVHTMTNKYFEGTIPKINESKLEEIDKKFIENLDFYKEFNNFMQDLEFFKALDLLFTKIRDTNAYVNETSPWKIEDKEKLANVISILNSSIKLFGEFIDCFMPQKALKLREQYNFSNEFAFKFESLENHKLGEKENLFQKIKLEDKNNKGKENNQKEEKAIVFDFDGVILDSSEAKFAGYYKTFENLENSKENVDKGFKKLGPVNRKILIKEILSNYSKEEQDKFEEYCEKYENYTLSHVIDAPEIKGSIKSVQKLRKKGYKTFINTATPKSPMEKILKHKDWNQYFDKVFTYDDGNKVKNTKQILKQFNIKKENLIFVGDGETDLRCAKELNLNFIGVKNELNNFENEKFIKYVINDLTNLVNLVKNFENQKPKEDKNNQSQPKEGFEALNLKVGKILSVEQHPEAEKLYIEKIDIGEDEPRQIVSGLKNYYEKEDMLGKKVIVVANLKPAKLRGVKSQGMILVSENEEENKLGLLNTDEEVGTNLEWNGKIANNETKIKVDKFFDLKLTCDGQKVFLEDKEITANKKSLIIDRNIKGIVC